MIKKENNKAALKKESKEAQIITMLDLKCCNALYQRHIYQEVFYCPKCQSSLISLSENYSKNNTANLMDDEEKDPNSHLKIILHCENCNCTDLLPKFLKEIERKKDNNPWNVSVGYPKPYNPAKPYYIKSPSYNLSKTQKINTSKLLSPITTKIFKKKDRTFLGAI